MGNDDQPTPAEHAVPVDTEDIDPRWHITPTKIAVTIILAVAIVFPLLTRTYARETPRLFGFPFFYWYQFVWVFLAAGCCGLSYLLLRRENRRFAAAHPNGLTPPTGPPPDDPAPSEQVPGRDTQAAQEQRKNARRAKPDEGAE